MGYSGQGRPPWDKELNEEAKGVTVQASGEDRESKSVQRP